MGQEGALVANATPMLRALMRQVRVGRNYPLFPYQLEGVAWLKHMETQRPPLNQGPYGGVLGDEPGVGKTRQMITLILNDTPRPTRTIIFTPKNVQSQWEVDFQDVDINVFVREGKTWVQRTHPLNPVAPSVYLLTHRKALQFGDEKHTYEDHPSELVPLEQWNRIVVDEAHQVANEGGKTHMSIAYIRRMAPLAPMWLLTGTPVVNSMFDVCGLNRLIDNRPRPAKVVKYTRDDIMAVTRWMLDNALQRQVSDLREQYRGVVPFPAEPRIETIKVDITNPQEKKVYDDIYVNMQELLQRYEERAAKLGLPEQNEQAQKFRILSWLEQMNITPDVYIAYRLAEVARQEAAPEVHAGTGNPPLVPLDEQGVPEVAVVIPPKLNEPSAKMLQVRDLMIEDMATHGPQHWLIFAWFKEEFDVLTSFFDSLVDDTGRKLVGRTRSINGESNDKEVKAIIEKYKDARAGTADPGDPVPAGENDVLLVQLMSGGVGLNLQNCTRVVFLSSWWTPAAMQQAIGRAVRLGQREVVKVWRVQLNHVAERLHQRLSVDARKMDRTELKEKLLKELMNGVRRSYAAKYYVGEPFSAGEREGIVHTVLDLHTKVKSMVPGTWECEQNLHGETCGTKNLNASIKCKDCGALNPKCSMCDDPEYAKFSEATQRFCLRCKAAQDEMERRQGGAAAAASTAGSDMIDLAVDEDEEKARHILTSFIARVIRSKFPTKLEAELSAREKAQVLRKVRKELLTYQGAFPPSHPKFMLYGLAVKLLPKLTRQRDQDDEEEEREMGEPPLRRRRGLGGGSTDLDTADLLTDFVSRMTQYREHNVSLLEARFCSAMETVPVSTLRALYMMLTLYECDATVFVHPDGSLKGRGALCAAIVRNLKMSRSGWIMALIRLPAQIRQAVNKFLHWMHVTAGVGAVGFITLFSPLGPYMNLALSVMTTGLVAHSYLATLKSKLFWAGFLDMVETRGFSESDKQALTQALQAAHATEQRIFQEQLMTLDKVGDLGWYERCSAITEETDVRQFRKDLVTAKKRWFQGRQLLAVHLFDVNGEARQPNESCLAFMHYKAGMFENVAGY